MPSTGDAPDTETAENPGVVFTAPRAVTLRDEPVPVPAAGQVLVRTAFSLISTGTELTLLRGEATGESWRGMTHYPRGSGYSNVGQVLETGPGVDPGWRGLWVHNHGRHQAFTLSPEDRLAALPDGVARQHATFASLAKVAMNGLRRAALTWGETVAVVGQGLVGQLASRLALVAGARRVLAVDTSARRLERLPERAELRVFAGDIRDESLRRKVLEAAGEHGVDLVVEATGHAGALAFEPLLLRPQGRFLLLSSPRGTSTFDFHDLCNRRSLSFVGAHGFSHPPAGSLDNVWSSRRHGELFLDLSRRGVIDVEPLISHRFPAARAAEAYALLLEDPDDAMGVVLDW